tara:strand:+ start:263 stop:661 length:399 start_codon:yes stop_codon:yes gene_type:complete
LLIGRKDWFSKRVALTWKILGTPSNRLLFQLVPQTHPIEETEFGLLLKTPTVMDGEVTSGKKNPSSGDSGTLAQEIMSEYPPTMQKLGMLSAGKTSQLNPLFVEEMMGFPKNWTALPFQSGEGNQSKHMETL